MGADTSFHADQAGREVGKPGIELAAGEFLAQNDGAALVEADEVKGVLADVDAENGDGVFRVARHGRAPCLGEPPARRWGTAKSTAGPSHSDVPSQVHSAQLFHLHADSS